MFLTNAARRLKVSKFAKVLMSIVIVMAGITALLCYIDSRAHEANLAKIKQEHGPTIAFLHNLNFDRLSNEKVNDLGWALHTKGTIEPEEIGLTEDHFDLYWKWSYLNREWQKLKDRKPDESQLIESSKYFENTLADLDLEQIRISVTLPDHTRTTPTIISYDERQAVRKAFHTSVIKVLAFQMDKLQSKFDLAALRAIADQMRHEMQFIGQETKQAVEQVIKVATHTNPPELMCGISCDVLKDQQTTQAPQPTPRADGTCVAPCTTYIHPLRKLNTILYPPVKLGHGAMPL